MFLTHEHVRTFLHLHVVLGRLCIFVCVCLLRDNIAMTLEQLCVFNESQYELLRKDIIKQNKTVI